MPAAPKTYFSKTEVCRRFRAARRQVLGGTIYIIDFQRRGQGLPLDIQQRDYSIADWQPALISRYFNNPVREVWDGDMLNSIEEVGCVCHGFVLDACRYIRGNPLHGDPIEELYDNALIWLGTPLQNPRVRICGLNSGWQEIAYLRPARQATPSPFLAHPSHA